jgi:hypothetical protein
MNAVMEIPAAPSNQALEYFSRQLSYETNCWDVHEDLNSGNPVFSCFVVRQKLLSEPRLRSFLFLDLV